MKTHNKAALRSIFVFLAVLMGIFFIPAPESMAQTENKTVYLSDLTPVSAKNGWGPYEKDRSNGERYAGDGNILKLNGVTFRKGLGVHANSELVYNLDGVSCTNFSAQVGIDDEMRKGSVAFSVYGDGTKLYDSGTMRYYSATKSVSLDITGKKVLKLRVSDAGDHIHGDHGDWADAKITCWTNIVSGPAPAPIPTQSDTIKVLQWNNAGEAGEENAEVVKIVAEKPQIVFLQEVDSATHATRILNALKADQGGTAWETYVVPRGTDGGHSQVVIISKYDLTNAKYVDLRRAGSYGLSCYNSGAVRYWAGRRAVGANININGRNISIFSTRMSSDYDMSCVRDEEVRILKNWAYNPANGFHADKIFGGDYNMQPSRTEYGTWIGSPNSAIDTWQTAVNAKTATADNDSTPDTNTPTKNTRLDYIFINSNSGLWVKSALIRNVGTLSDHRMMITELEAK